MKIPRDSEGYWDAVTLPVGDDLLIFQTNGPQPYDSGDYGDPLPYQERGTRIVFAKGGRRDVYPGLQAWAIQMNATGVNFASGIPQNLHLWSKFLAATMHHGTVFTDKALHTEMLKERGLDPEENMLTLTEGSLSYTAMESPIHKPNPRYLRAQWSLPNLECTEIVLIDDYPRSSK